MGPALPVCWKRERGCRSRQRKDRPCIACVLEKGKGLQEQAEEGWPCIACVLEKGKERKFRYRWMGKRMEGGQVCR